MNKLLNRNIVRVVAVAVGLSGFAVATPSLAHHHDGGAFVAAGVLAFIAGAAVASANQPHYYRNYNYYDGPPARTCRHVYRSCRSYYSHYYHDWVRRCYHRVSYDYC